MQVLLDSLLGTVKDIIPILFVIGFFQTVALKQKIPNLPKIIFGMVLVIVGLSIFLVGLEKGVFPVGIEMANQLSSSKFTGVLEQVYETGNVTVDAAKYLWVYVFAFMIGFSTTLAEPALIAVALKARDISTGAISPWGLRIAVALGVAIGIALGTYRIVVGTPLYVYIISGYIFLVVQTYLSPKLFIPLAYDCGGVTTSTVTVPLVAALGIGLATNVPGRSPLIDGFGLIAFASLFPMITVLGYAKIAQIISNRSTNN